MLLIKFEISLDRALGLKSAVIILLFLLKVSLSKWHHMRWVYNRYFGMEARKNTGALEILSAKSPVENEQVLAPVVGKCITVMWFVWSKFGVEPISPIL